MPRKPLVDFGDVASAAEQLVASGQEPNARNVRALLGVGSMATILRHLQAWQKSRASQVDGPPLPADLVQILKRYAFQQVAQATAELQKRLADRQSEMDEVIKEAESSAAQVVEVERDLSSLRESAADLNGRLAVLTEELSAARKAEAAARAAQTKTEARLEACQGVKDELAQVRAALIEERARRIAAEREAKKPPSKRRIVKATVKS